MPLISQAKHRNIVLTYQLCLERKTRLELATTSLEDWNSTIELLPQVFIDPVLGRLCLDLNLRYVSTSDAKNLRWRVPDTIPSPGAVYKRFANRETVVCCGTILQRTNSCRLRPSQFRGWSSTAPHTKR